MPRMVRIVQVMPYPTDNSDLTGAYRRTVETRRDRQKDIMEQTPYRISKPLIMTMMLFGLLHLKYKTWGSRKWVPGLTKTYALFILVLLWLNFLRLFGIYGQEQPFGNFLLLKIVLHAWYLMCAIQCTVSFNACHYDNRFREFLTRWLELTRTNRQSNPDVTKKHLDTPYMKYMSHGLFTFSFIGWIIFLLNLVCTGYLLFSTTLLDVSIYPMPLDHRYTFLVKCIVFIIHVYLSAVWVFTLCLFSMMCFVVNREFEIFNQDFRAAITTDCEMPISIETFRRRHQRICRIVVTTDDTLKAFNISGVGFSMCVAMLALYNIVWQDGILSHPLVISSHIFWLVASFAYVFVIAFACGYLNHMAHAPLKAIHDIKVDRTSPEYSLQMNIFLNKLTGESIGLTAMDLFVIDKPTILTIAGVFTTYFIVLIQFQQPTLSIDDPSTCNCTEILLNSTLQCFAMP